jgi:hypothetical protein
MQTHAVSVLATAVVQVQRDNAAIMKDIGSLSSAEAEASAQRSSLKAQVWRCRQPSWEFPSIQAP